MVPVFLNFLGSSLRETFILVSLGACFFILGSIEPSIQNKSKITRWINKATNKAKVERFMRLINIVFVDYNQ